MPSRSELQERVAGSIEEQTARVPSIGYMIAGLGALAASGILRGFGKKQTSLFVGQFAPALFLLGVYRKLRSA